MYQVQGNASLPANIEVGVQYGKDRTKWQRPQLMVWADNEGVFGGPQSSGTTYGNTYPWGREGENFIITSDHNRSALSVDQLRLENRMRMVGGNMRSYYTGQKVTLNCSWNLLPSRAYQREVFVGEKTTPYSQWPYGQKNNINIPSPSFMNGPLVVTVVFDSQNEAKIKLSTNEAAIQAFKIIDADDNVIYGCGYLNPPYNANCNKDPDGNHYYTYTRKTNVDGEKETEVSLKIESKVGGTLSSTPYDISFKIDFSLIDNSFEMLLPTSEFTADGGAGGADLLQWYRNTHGPFWVYLSYDNYPNFEGNTDVWNQFNKYSDRYMMYFTSFNYSVEKRGLYDFWSVSVSLEEA